MNAAQAAILSFAAIILFGAFLLRLPVSTHGTPLGFIDALFTATSATCVTGLVVVDTGTKFTAFGQSVIIILIQAGGFGIMTLSTFILFMLGKRASLQFSDAAGGSFLKLRRYSLSEMLKRAFLLTLTIESLGVIILLLRWSRDYPLEHALWLSVFHSISAFCNSGFSLFPDSLMRYAGDPMINFTMMILIVIGGVGFFVLIDLFDFLRRDKDPAKRRISFHTKIVLLMSSLLIITGAVFLFAIERNHNLAGLSYSQAALRALFQSITSRTAGFNTLDIKHLANASIFLLIILMFVGGAPGSMAGGIKVTTLGVLFIAVLSRLRGMGRPGLFGRSVSRFNLERAIALFLIAGGLIAFITMALLVTELGGVSHAESRGLFLEMLFECVSAFGTVGLSTGVTSNLSSAGRILITITMFIGRLGPLTLAFAMERRRPGVSYRYPAEQIMIG